jgi:DNA-binding transcriptional ArsR family regulator
MLETLTGDPCRASRDATTVPKGAVHHRRLIGIASLPPRARTGALLPALGPWASWYLVRTSAGTLPRGFTGTPFALAHLRISAWEGSGAWPLADDAGVASGMAETAGAGLGASSGFGCMRAAMASAWARGYPCPGAGALLWPCPVPVLDMHILAGCGPCPGRQWLSMINVNKSGRAINPRSSTPVFRQLVEILTAQIESGELPADEQMPSRRELTERYGVARGTVTKAVSVLQDAGIVYVVVGKGAYPYAKDKRPKSRRIG